MAVELVTFTYYGNDKDTSGLPTPFFNYLVVLSPWVRNDSATASIIPLTEAAIKSQDHSFFVADKLGIQGALRDAEVYLDKKHKELNKLSSNEIKE